MIRRIKGFIREQRISNRPLYIQLGNGTNCEEGVEWTKKCTPAELVSIQRACFSVGINPVIKGYSFIGGMVPPAGLKNVEFERFDIDDMPGTSVITSN